MKSGYTDNWKKVKSRKSTMTWENFWKLKSNDCSNTTCCHENIIKKYSQLIVTSVPSLTCYDHKNTNNNRIMITKFHWIASLCKRVYLYTYSTESNSQSLMLAIYRYEFINLQQFLKPELTTHNTISHLKKWK